MAFSVVLSPIVVCSPTAFSHVDRFRCAWWHRLYIFQSMSKRISHVIRASVLHFKNDQHKGLSMPMTSHYHNCITLGEVDYISVSCHRCFKRLVPSPRSWSQRAKCYSVPAVGFNLSMNPLYRMWPRRIISHWMKWDGPDILQCKHSSHF